MNKRVLQKIIDNLNSEKPDLSYIRGILETLIEGLPDDIKFEYKGPAIVVPPGKIVLPGDDEGAQLDMVAKAKLAKVKALTKYD